MFKHWNKMYYITLIFTLLPILTTYQQSNYVWIVIGTILFVIAYLTVLNVSNKWLSYFSWLMMGAYIIWCSYIGLNMSMFLMFQINVLTFHFSKHTYRSIYWIIFYLEIVVLYIVLIYLQLTLLEILQVTIICMFIFLSHVILKSNMQRTQLEKTLRERNQSLNLLLADHERQRISQDLHDTLGHVFVTLTIKSELVATYLQTEKYELALKEVNDLRHITQTSMKEVREIIHNMKQLTLSDELQIIQEMLTLVNIQLTIKNQYDINKLSMAEQASLSMILRELVNNLLKHSGASVCHISLLEKNKQVVMLFEDNGCGFDQVTGNELHSIRDRLTKHQGQMTIVSLAKPTQIEIVMPVEG